jgi:hypothetical protein
MFCLNLQRDLDHPRGLEANELNMVGQVLPVRMVIALFFFKRLFTRSLSMDQAHGLIIGEYATCWSPRNHAPLWSFGSSATRTLAPVLPGGGTTWGSSQRWLTSVGGR